MGERGGGVLDIRVCASPLAFVWKQTPASERRRFKKERPLTHAGNLFLCLSGSASTSLSRETRNIVIHDTRTDENGRNKKICELQLSFLCVRIYLFFFFFLIILFILTSSRVLTIALLLLDNFLHHLRHATTRNALENTQRRSRFGKIARD